MDDNASIAPAAPAANAGQANNTEPSFSAAASLRLAPFWPDTPAAWFGMAECQFHLRRITDERDKFCILVSSLSKDSIRLVSHLVEQPPADLPYTTLKATLLSSHQLTDFQRVELLHRVEPLGGRRPSELLAVMMELCPRGQENNIFFQFMFLQRLPKEIRIMLAEDDHGDLRRLAEKADKLWSLHSRQGHDLVAAMSDVQLEDEGAVAAVQGGYRQAANKKFHGKSAAKKPATPSSGVANPSPAYLARDSAGLCFYHWTFGEKATKCKEPCSWQGN